MFSKPRHYSEHDDHDLWVHIYRWSKKEKKCQMMKKNKFLYVEGYAISQIRTPTKLRLVINSPS